MKLDASLLARCRLQAELFAARRGGWLLLAVAFTLAVCTAAMAAAAHRRERVAMLHVERAAWQSQLAASARAPFAALPAVMSPADALLAALPVDDAGATQAQWIITRALRMGLRVRQATYIAAQDGSHSAVQSLQVHLPLRGTSAAFRRWADDVLRTWPNVAIDSLTMERADASEFELNIQVRLSIWQRSAAHLPGPRSAHRDTQGGPPT